MRAQLPERAAGGLPQRVGHAVPSPLLPQWQPRRPYPLHERRRAEEADIDALREALRKAKGPGNFRNLFLYSPNGKKDGVQVIPISEVAAKDEFIGIKDGSRDHILAAHRVPPQLMGIIPKNTGGFGDVEKATRVFAENELKQLQARFASLNDWVGAEVVRFAPYSVTQNESG